eukprot:g3271.t1
MYSGGNSTERFRLLPETVSATSIVGRWESFNSGDFNLEKKSHPEDQALACNSEHNKSQPLSFFDDYTIEAGVPTFSFTTHGDEARQFGRVFAISSDGTHLAVSKTEDHICVCCLLDYLTIAEGVNLVPNDCFIFLSFMNDSNDELVAITQHGKITFISMLNHSITDEHEKPLQSQLRELELAKMYQIDDSFREGDDWHFVAEVQGRELWLTEWTTEGTIALRISRVTRHHFQQVKVYSGLNREPSAVQMWIHARAVIAMFLWNYEPQRNYTILCNGIDVTKRELYQNPIRIPGKCIAQNDSGMYFLFWRYYDDETSDLMLYSNEGLQSQTPVPVVSMTLASGVVSVKATFLDRAVWPFDELKGNSPFDMPLVCILIARSSGIVILTWDSSTKQIIKEIDTKLKGLHISQRSQIEFCVSPNLQWFAVGCWKDAIIGLFSFVSGVKVWSLRLDLVYVDSPMFLPFTFDKSSSKLIINGKKELFVFLPPCLVDDYRIEYRSQCFELKLDWEVSFRNLNINYQRLISQRLLFSLLTVNFDLEDDNGRIAIARSKFTSKTAVVVYNEEELSLVIATWEQVFSYAFHDWLRAAISPNDAKGMFNEVKNDDFSEITIDRELCRSFAAKVGKCHVMFCESKDNTSDSVALFALGEGINAIFIDLDTNSLEFYYLDEEEWFGFTQSKDGLRATCFRESGILVIDLERRMVLKKVDYNFDLLFILHTYRPERNFDLSRTGFMMDTSIKGKEIEFWATQTSKNFTSPCISSDGEQVLLGWDSQISKPILVTPMTSKEELEELDNRQTLNLMPCWALDETMEKFAFLEFDEHLRKIAVIGVYNHKDRRCIRMDNASWTPHMKHVLEGMTTNDLLTFDLCFDEITGYLWITSIVKKIGTGEMLILLPIGPFSMQGCVPCLYMQDYPIQEIRKDQLDELELQFGSALYDMPFNGMTNIHLSLIHKDVSMTGALLKNASENDVEIALTVLKRDKMDSFHNLLEIAIQQKSESVVIAILDILGEHLTPFITSAFATRRCFEDLWKGYRKVFERMLKKDLLYWDLSILEVPSDVFTDDYLSARVGTCTEVWPWNNSNNKKATSEYWRASHDQTVKDIERKGNLTQVTATLKIFCIDDVCKVGLNGIVRFLVTHNAPSRIYKCSLVRWCITWKWEHIWKSYSKKSFISYLIFLAVFSTYAILIGMYGNKLDEEGIEWIVLTAFMGFCCLMTLTVVPEKIIQIMTYTEDGNKLFPQVPFWGVKYYLGSRWNLVEVLTCVIMLFLILPLHLASLYFSFCIPCLYVVLAFECIVVWLKIWNYAQAFAETGALVLMIENVIRDCVFFLVLAGVVLVAFGIALFIMFQHVIRHHESSPDDDETFENIKSSFKNPQKVLLTLFYAMIGTYEVEVYSDSGSLSPFIVFTFVVYLSIQSIVMFNLLIAIMSDTYDRVKSTEEEQLLMGRARFIDACEAALTKNQIKKMESGIGKYLYVILQQDVNLSEELTLWQGRVKVIEENVRKIVTKSQATIMENMRRDISVLKEEIKGDINILDHEMKRDMKNLKVDVKRDMKNLETNMRGEMTHIERNMQGSMTLLQENMNSEIGNLREYVAGDIGNLQDNMKKDMSNLDGNMKEETSDLERTIKEDISKLKDDMSALMSLMETQIQSENLNTRQQFETIIEYLRGGYERQPSASSLFRDIE